jgi:SAM-dependent methyltransferase
VADERTTLAGTFDSAAESYQEARPQYPERLFDRLVSVTGLQPGDRVIEVGAGPGKATLPLARRGLRITALEPGPALAARARRDLAGYPVEVVEARLEDWDGEPSAYAAVIAATSWHWVDPEVRYLAAARALQPGGHLAIWSATHVFPAGGDPFFDEIQEVYDAIGEGLPPGAPHPAPGELPDQSEEIEASGLFDMVAVEHLDWTVDYDAEGYIRLLSTFSGHIAMARDRRERFFHRDPAPPGTPTRRARTPRMGHCAEHRAPTTDCLAAPFSQDGPHRSWATAAAPTACGTGAGPVNEKGPRGGRLVSSVTCRRQRFRVRWPRLCRSPRHLT